MSLLPVKNGFCFPNSYNVFALFVLSMRAIRFLLVGFAEFLSRPRKGSPMRPISNILSAVWVLPPRRSVYYCALGWGKLDLTYKFSSKLRVFAAYKK